MLCLLLVGNHDKVVLYKNRILGKMYFQVSKQQNGEVLFLISLLTQKWLPYLFSLCQLDWVGFPDILCSASLKSVVD